MTISAPVFVSDISRQAADDRHDVGLHRVVTRREDAGDEVEVLLAHPDHLQEPPQFEELEYDDQRNGPD